MSCRHMIKQRLDTDLQFIYSLTGEAQIFVVDCIWTSYQNQKHDSDGFVFLRAFITNGIFLNLM